MFAKIRRISREYFKISQYIIAGIAAGKGVWEQFLITAHPQLSKDSAEVMVKYILSVKQ